MPKLVAYDGRFELIRRAVVKIAADEGASAVSFERVGNELGISASSVRRTMQYTEGVLIVLGLQLLQRRWNLRYRFGLSGREGSEPRAQDVYAEEARWWANAHPEDVAWARAWFELAGGSGRHPVAAVQQFIDWRNELFDEAVTVALATKNQAADADAAASAFLRSLLDGLLVGLVEDRLSLSRVDALLEAGMSVIPDAGEAPR